MKPIRFGKTGKERPGVLLDEKLYDVPAFVVDYKEELFGNGGLNQLKQTRADHPVLPEEAALSIKGAKLQFIPVKDNHLRFAVGGCLFFCKTF